MRQLCIIQHQHYKCIIICNTAPSTFTKLWHYFFIFVLLHNISFLVIVQLSRGIFYICIFILGWNSVTLWHYMNDITWHYMTLHDITWHYMTLRDITWHYVTFRDVTSWQQGRTKMFSFVYNLWLWTTLTWTNWYVCGLYSHIK